MQITILHPFLFYLTKKVPFWGIILLSLGKLMETKKKASF